MLVTACAPSSAWALANCYVQAQQQFQKLDSIADAKLIPADRWLAMTAAERKQTGDVQIVSAVDSDHCRRDEVLPGGVRVTSGKFSVPFGYYYELVAQAVMDRDKDRLIYLSENAKPADKDVDALFALYDLPPPGIAGGWNTFQVLANVYQLNLDQGQWLKYGLLTLFQAMGGKATHDCKVHTPPQSMVSHGLLQGDAYRDVLSRFGLKTENILDKHSADGTVIFTLEGCTQ